MLQSRWLVGRVSGLARFPITLREALPQLELLLLSWWLVGPLEAKSSVSVAEEVWGGAITAN